MATTRWALRSQTSLVEQFVGQSLHDIPLPAAVLDIAKVRRNCARMLEAVDELNFDFLPEVSSHKTTEITRLQLGANAEEVRVLVTSLWEATKLLPLLLDYQITGVQVNITYGVPLTPSQVEDAAEISKQLGRRGGNIRFLLDHISQVDLVEQVGETSGYPPRVYILVDIGDGFSGVRPGTPEFRQLFSRIEQIVLSQGSQSLAFVGFYSDIAFPDESSDLVSHLRLLDRQLAMLLHASPIEVLRLTVRAPPNLWLSLHATEELSSRELSKLKHTLVATSEANHAIEAHSGDYVTLDLRSLVHNSQATFDGTAALMYDDIALTILTEVSSLYPRRGENGRLEAFISVGGSAFQDGVGCGGVVSQWNMKSRSALNTDSSCEWEISRCRGDSAVLVWIGENEPSADSLVGQRLRIYPYDASRAGDRFAWYYVVDSSRLGREDEIVDIFVRWRG
ncbi:uncharacterized protein LY89DRAFT_645282 [Mollisia scopiformis]|uniref:D-serine dehydratase-like domain-containing protein n=1 Tax=Mollisia scopiformis TaxID=149040 RepID=A0A194XC07_MOLSC|nr:uncharacterized protein LY89DRAFT_645282 [Mollisia scopiformis]KUJ17691.1 hypothetical protein LY89DRAFT_645282 [Mollisia scopiformis]